MPKLILRCNYLNNSPPTHLANYINYIGTRDGVESHKKVWLFFMPGTHPSINRNFFSFS